MERAEHFADQAEAKRTFAAELRQIAR